MIELKHVSKTFDAGTAGGVDALKDVSLTIEDGDIYRSEERRVGKEC